jgi:hypothetical protein
LFVSAHNATGHFHPHDQRCGTHISEQEIAETDAIAKNFMTRVCNTKSLNSLRLCQSASVRSKNPVEVPVWYHVVHSGNTGKLTEAEVQAQYEQVNKDFSGEENPQEKGYDMDIKFKFAGSTYTDNAQWFGDMDRYEDAVKAAVAEDNRYNFNQYFGNFRGGGLLGFCYFPNSFPESSYRHGCVNLYSSVPGGSSGNYNEGKTTTHETGHGIGLYHTFQGGCNGHGDQWQDTCPQRFSTSGCPNTPAKSCGLQCSDPIHNYMDYSYDRCMWEFTEGQNERANYQLSTFRPSLYLGKETVELIERTVPGVWDEAREYQARKEAEHVERRKALLAGL